MLESPILRTVFLFLGCYFLVNFLGMFGWLLPALAVAAAGTVACVAWLHHVDHARLVRLHGNSAVAPVIGFVCTKVLGVQAPVGADPAAARQFATPLDPAPATTRTTSPRTASQEEEERDESHVLRLVTSEDFERARSALTATVRGNDANIARLMRSVEASATVRALSARDAIQPPLGIYLCVGPKGLGKRTLARAFGEIAYRPPGFTAIDLADCDDARAELISAAKHNPFQAIALLDVDRASEEFLRDLSTIAETGALRDTKGVVSFRHCVLFLCADRASVACQRLRAMGSGAGITGQIQIITADTAFDARLASVIDEMLFFELPSPETQAEVVLALMENECAKCGQELRHVAPGVLVREVESIERTKSFEQAPGRIARLMRPAILAARSSGRLVEVLASTEGEPSRS